MGIAGNETVMEFLPHKPLNLMILMALPTPSNLFAAVAALIFLRIARRRYFSPLSQIPGPFFASFTRFWHVYHLFVGDHDKKIIELHQKYGPFIRIAPHEVSVCHPNGTKAVLMAPLLKGDWYKVVVFPDWRFPSTMSMTDPKKKAVFMKYFSNMGFSMSSVMKYEDTLSENISKLLGWMNKHAESNKAMDLDKFFTYVAFDTAAEVTFSRPLGFIDKGEDIENAIATNTQLQKFLVSFGHYRWVFYMLANPFTTWLKLLPVGHIVEIASNALSDRKKNPDSRFDMSAYWFRGLEKAEKENFTGYTERHLLAAASSNIAAGSDPMSCSLQSTTYHMIRRPETWARARAEIDTAQKEGRCEGYVVSWEDASKLTYLEACIKEGMRIHAPVSLSLPRVVPSGGLTIGNTTFAEGTILSISGKVIHTSTALWGDDALEYKPERWFAPDISVKEKHFMPWGQGWASCPGQHLSRVELFKIIATIVRDYDIEQVDPTQEWSSSAHFLSHPKDWPVYITKRSES